MENLLVVATGGPMGSLAGYIIVLFARKFVQFLQASDPLDALGYIPASNISQPRRL